LRIVISNRAGVPIYEQIKEQILTGTVQEGELLPSIRQLAHDLKISVITTTRAYNDLEQEGFIVTVQGKGSYVQAQNSDLVREQLLREVEAGLLAATRSARIARLPKAEVHQMLDLIYEADEYE
jgi:GntR family transcriptional regulator